MLFVKKIEDTKYKQATYNNKLYHFMHREKKSPSKKEITLQ